MMKTFWHGMVHVLLTFAVATWLPSAVRAEEFKLPSADELATLPPEGLEFYAAGIKALDHVDYDRAYENLVKAAALQPHAVRLNLIVAALALKHGRSKKADEARDYYATAIRAYENILSVAGLEPAFRRDVENRLKIAKEEREQLAQRDAQREGRGNMFIKQLNRELAKATKTPKPAAAPAPQVPSAGAVSGVLGAQPATMPALPAYPGAATPPAAAMPALPGAPAAALGEMPGAPAGMPALPGAGQPAPQPGPPAGAGEPMI